MPASYAKIPNKSAISNLHLAISSPLRLVFVGADLILGARYWIVRHSLGVHAISIRILHLLVAGPVAFDRAFVEVLVVLLLPRHRCHDAAPYIIAG